MKKYLVTGSAGFIGSHLVEHLLNKNNSVVGLDNFDIFYSRSIKENNLSRAREYSNFSQLEVNLLDKTGLENVFDNNQFDAVIHLGAKAGVRPSILNPQGYYETNVIGTLNLLECLKSHNIKKFVFASSSSVYGNNEKTPFSEEDIVDFPISPYAASKKAGELLCHTYHHLYGINIFCLRFFTVYGPRQRPDLMIHKFADRIYHNVPIDIYGNGSSMRDYTYIDDIISALLSALEKVDGYSIFNVGNSSPLKILYVIDLLEKELGKKALINFKEEQQGDVLRTYADIKKAGEVLGYKPKTKFEDGIRCFIGWYLNNIKNKKC